MPQLPSPYLPRADTHWRTPFQLQAACSALGNWTQNPPLLAADARRPPIAGACIRACTRYPACCGVPHAANVPNFSFPTLNFNRTCVNMFRIELSLPAITPASRIKPQCTRAHRSMHSIVHKSAHAFVMNGKVRPGPPHSRKSRMRTWPRTSGRRHRHSNSGEGRRHGTPCRETECLADRCGASSRTTAWARRAGSEARWTCSTSAAATPHRRRTPTTGRRTTVLVAVRERPRHTTSTSRTLRAARQ